MVDEQDLLTEYIDGSLYSERRAALESHISECASCQAELVAERWLEAFMSEDLEKSPPPDFTQMVLSRTREESTRVAQSVPPTMSLAVVYTIAAAALTLAVYKLQGELGSAWRTSVASLLALGESPLVYGEWFADIQGVTVRAFSAPTTQALIGTLLLTWGIYTVFSEEVIQARRH